MRFEPVNTYRVYRHTNRVTSTEQGLLASHQPTTTALLPSQQPSSAHAQIHSHAPHRHRPIGVPFHMLPPEAAPATADTHTTRAPLWHIAHARMPLIQAASCRRAPAGSLSRSSLSLPPARCGGGCEIGKPAHLSQPTYARARARTSVGVCPCSI